MLDDGGRLANAQVQDTVELDEIFTAFDPETRQAFRDWVTELSAAIKDGRGQDLNDAFGNFEGFAVDGAKLMTVLDEQNVAVHRLVKNTGAGVRRDQRAPRRAARADRELQAHLRGHRLARRGAGRDLRDLPDLPRREQGDDGAARGLLALHAPARERPEGPGGRPRADGARPGRPRSRPRAPVPRPRAADPREPHGRARPRAHAARGRAAHRGAAHVLPGAQPDPVATSTSTSRRSPASSRTAGPTSRPTTARGSAVRPRSGHHRGPLLRGLPVRRRPRRRGPVATRTSSRTRSAAR